jgi:tRNA (cmo5U34)-methyltransferase
MVGSKLPDPEGETKNEEGAAAEPGEEKDNSPKQDPDAQIEPETEVNRSLASESLETAAEELEKVTETALASEEPEKELTAEKDGQKEITPEAEAIEAKPGVKVDATVWKSASLVESYLKRIRKGLPMAEAQLDVMMRVIEGRGRPVQNFMDLGCGDGILAAAILSEYPEATGVLVDFSMPMINAALHNLKDYTHTIHFVTLNYADPSWFNMVAQRGPFDVVVSGYSIHHQTDEQKKQVYADIFDLLEPGGVFINMEHVASPSPWLTTLHDTFFIDSLWVSQVGDEKPKSRAQVAQEYHSRADKEANVLTPLERQCHWLRQIGFEDVDCYFKAFELAIFGGRRTRADE